MSSSCPSSLEEENMEDLSLCLFLLDVRNFLKRRLMGSFDSRSESVHVSVDDDEDEGDDEVEDQPDVDHLDVSRCRKAFVYLVVKRVQQGQACKFDKLFCIFIFCICFLNLNKECNKDEHRG